MAKATIIITVYLALALVWGCSSDPDTPLGLEFIDGGLIGSEPGEVTQDTILLSIGDTTFVKTAVMYPPATVTVGRTTNFETASLLRLNFSGAGADTNRTVTEAFLNFRVANAAITDTLDALFFELANRLSNGEDFVTLALGDTIPDDQGETARELKVFPRTYSLPPALVQGWIRAREHNGIAIVLDDPAVTSTEIAFGSSKNPDEGLRPFLRVFFSDGNERSYFIGADGTFVTPLTPPANLTLGDGFVRRVFVPVDLSGIDPETLLHEATFTLNIVPLTFTGGDINVSLYAPERADANDPLVVSGQSVSANALNIEGGKVQFSVRNIVAQWVAETDPEAAFVLKFTSEGTFARQVEFYSGTAADSLKPALDLTVSSAPRFP